jgi:hypothetical protein
MDVFQNWRDYLNHLFTSNGQFQFTEKYLHNGTDIEIYHQQKGDKETQINVGYLIDGRLITLNIFNSKTPGHNAEQIEYFYENDFDETTRIGSVGLQYTEGNIKAITSALKAGLQGVERKFYRDNRLVFSKVYKPIGDNAKMYSQMHYFAKRNMILRFVDKIFSSEKKYEIKDVELNKVFSGLS